MAGKGTCCARDEDHLNLDAAAEAPQQTAEQGREGGREGVDWRGGWVVLDTVVGVSDAADRASAAAWRSFYYAER